MNNTLLGDDCKNYPAPFENLISKLKRKEECEFLFIGIVYNILESGFILYDKRFDGIDTIDYNQNSLKKINDLPLESFYRLKSNTFEAKIRLGRKGNSKVYLLGEPSNNSLSKYLVTNILIKKPYRVASHCFKIADYIESGYNGLKFKNRLKLSILVKDNLATPIKQELVYYFNISNAPILSRLPLLVINKISSYLNFVEKSHFQQALETI